MSDGKMTYEDWLRGCVYHDGRHGYVTLPCDEVLKIADFIERLRADHKTEPTISKMEQVDKDINVRSKGEQTDCNGCKFVGTYETEFPCANCSRKTKDYYAKDEPQTDWKDQMWAEAVEQREHDILHEPTYDLDDGSM